MNDRDIVGYIICFVQTLTIERMNINIPLNINNLSISFIVYSKISNININVHKLMVLRQRITVSIQLIIYLVSIFNGMFLYI